MDIHSSTKSYKFTFSVEIIPICKDDLVALPIKLARAAGNIAPLALCYRVGTSLNVLDPNTLQTADVSTPVYWRAPFRTLADVHDLVDFIVMDIDPIAGHSKGRFVLAEATVCRASDLGVNDTTYYVRTHLGGVLHAGDTVLGYHLSGTNFNNPHLEALEKSHQYVSQIPDVVLVKKFYARKKKNHHKTRNWRLKRLGRQVDDADAAAHADGVKTKTLSRRQQELDGTERDYETFLRDIEEDADLRGTLTLYKATQPDRKRDKADRMQGLEHAAGALGADDQGTSTTGQVFGDVDHDHDEDDGDDLPVIGMDELLDEFDELDIQDQV